MGDMSFVYDEDKGYADLQISGGDFRLASEKTDGITYTDTTLETAIGLSLFTDRRATTAEVTEFQTGVLGRQSRRGYWPNIYRDFPQGSGMWLLSRAKKTELTRSRAEAFATESLKYLVDYGVASSVTPTAEFSGTSGLSLYISIVKPTGETVNYKYQYVWG